MTELKNHIDSETLIWNDDDSTIGLKNSGVVYRVADEDLSALLVVMPVAGFPVDHVVRALNTMEGAKWPLGIVIEAALAGGRVNIVTSGAVEDPSWNWTPGMPVWLGDGGTVMQGAFTGDQLVILGGALTPTQIYVRIQPPIQLA